MNESERPYDWEIDGFETFEQNVPIDTSLREKLGGWIGPTERRFILGCTVAMLAVNIGFSLPAVLRKLEAAEPCAPTDPQALSSTYTLFSAKPTTGEIRPENFGVKYYKPNKTTIDTIKSTEVSSIDDLSRLLAHANKFARQYDVELAVGSEKEIEEGTKNNTNEDLNTWQALTDKDVNPEIVKTDVINILEGLSSLPLEFVKSSGLKRILLFNGDKSETKAFVIYGNSPSQGTVYYELSKNSDESTIPHEVFHLFDEKVCGPGGSINDPAYEELNPSDIYGKVDEHSAFLSEENLESTATYINSLDRALDEHDIKRYCDLVYERQQKARRITVVNNESFENVAEDKAILGAEIGQPDTLWLYLDPANPVIRSKLIILLSRMYEKTPKVVKYLAAVSNVGLDPQEPCK